MADIEQIRKDINEIDNEMRILFEKRMDGATPHHSITDFRRHFPGAGRDEADAPERRIHRD